MKKGFTIIELLAVITLLAIIFTLVIPNIDKALKRSTDKLYEVKIKQVESSAELYVSKHEEKLNYSTNTTFYLTIQQLVDDGLIDADQINNPRTNKPLTGRVKVTYCIDTETSCPILGFTYEYIES